MRILIEALHQIAKDRPAGYLQDVLNHGFIHGPYLIIAPKDLETLKKKYSKSPLRGAGDLVAKIADPVKKVLSKVPTLKRVLDDCNCKQRQEQLNKAFPFQN